MPTRVLMWSGPRNISTAMMRAWDARPDTFVCDEPLYAHYLKETGLPHPGADEIMAAQETDWRAVVDWLVGPVPHDRDVFYQKHMAHHILPGMETAWIEGLANCFLIREPREMLTSLMKVIPDPAVEETGLPQQVAMFEQERNRTGRTPVVLDSRDVLEAPGPMLDALCRAIDVPYTAAMLSWAPGPRETDGVWAKHWYANVERSTGFGRYTPKDEAVPPHLEGTLDACQALYAQLYEHRLTASA